MRRHVFALEFVGARHEEGGELAPLQFGAQLRHAGAVRQGLGHAERLNAPGQGRQQPIGRAGGI